MEKHPDWQDLTDARYEKQAQILELVESLCDERLSEAEHRQVKQQYMENHGVCERTIRNYLSRYRAGGARELLKAPIRTSSPRIYDQHLADAIVALVNERPGRTVPMIRNLIAVDERLCDAISQVSDRTIYRFLAEQGFSHQERRRLSGTQARMNYHRFEAPGSMDLVQGDGRDGIWLDTPAGKQKTYLFVWVDDYSRKILSGRYYFDEKLPRMEDTFKRMVLRWGIPKRCYLDNGSVYIAKHFSWILGELQTKKIHHKPYQAYCKGKIEAANKTIMKQFQAEAQLAGFQTLEELNSAFEAWVDLEYNVRLHSQTGEAPDSRFTAGLPKSLQRISDISWFEALFFQREFRKVTKYGKIKFASNEYPVTCVPHGTVVEVRYDPFNLSEVHIFFRGTWKETTSVSKLLNRTAPVPQESRSSERQVSAQAVSYFQKLRDAHTNTLLDHRSSVSYGNLSSRTQEESS